MKSIRQPHGVSDSEAKKVLDDMKVSIETLRGERGTPIAQLTSTAATADIINKINEIITRLQG